MINDSFICEKCLKLVTKHPEGSARNHCPFCLYSKHMDEVSPGDRESKCGGLMQAIGIDYKKNKGNMIKHICIKCNKIILNKVAPDDDFIEFISILNKN